MDDYERERQRRILENRSMLLELGLTGSASLLPPTAAAATASPRRRKHEERGKAQIVDRDGYIISLPWPGEDEEVGGVGKDFRWRKWQGLDAELRPEMLKRNDATDQDSRRVTEKTEYASLPPGTCHPCRRRSEKEKMKCRNMDPECRATFCESCCKRYSYFEFDPYSRSSICPLCRDICSCANCIRKRDLEHLLAPGQSGIRAHAVHTLFDSSQSAAQLPPRSALTVEVYLDQMGGKDIEAPFDRPKKKKIKISKVGADGAPIADPALPQADGMVPKKRGRPKKNAALSADMIADAILHAIDPSAAAPAGKPKKTKKPKKADADETIELRIRAPAQPRREKPADSDGDSVHHALLDTDEDEATPPRKRLRFPELDGAAGRFLARSIGEIAYDSEAVYVPATLGQVADAGRQGSVSSALPNYDMHHPVDFDPMVSDPAAPGLHTVSLAAGLSGFLVDSASATPSDTPPPAASVRSPRLPCLQATNPATWDWARQPPAPTSEPQRNLAPSFDKLDDASIGGAVFDQVDQDAYVYGFPPPYSHSPPRTSATEDSADGASGRPAEPVEALDVLSLAAAEAGAPGSPGHGAEGYARKWAWIGRPAQRCPRAHVRLVQPV
ncbi:hypothetical protein Q5752_006582 [Cryptotrichosporon argae]